MRISVYDDVIRCQVPPQNSNSANILYARFGAKPPNLKTANISGYTVLSVIDSISHLLCVQISFTFLNGAICHADTLYNLAQVLSQCRKYAVYKILLSQIKTYNEKIMW